VTGPDLLRDNQPPPGWPLDRNPYYLETNMPGIFAAGDVRHGSAVGEGAMAVAFVLRYLAGVCTPFQRDSRRRVDGGLQVLTLAPVMGAVVVALWVGAYTFIFGVLLVALGFKLRSWEHDLTAGGALPLPAH
jgi:hypothetical protein